MGRAPSESAEEWYQRAIQTYQAMQEEERRHWHRLGFDRKVARGEPYPLIDPLFHEAMERAKAAEAELKEAAAAAANSRQP